jgi:hypothetical protein
MFRYVLLLLVAITGSEAMAQNLASANGSVFPRPNVVFIREGKTTRDEVLRAFEHMDTNASMDGLFWARWYEFACPVPSHGGQGALIKNLIVEFDDTGVVTHSEVAPEHLVVQALYRTIARLPVSSTMPESFTLDGSYWTALTHLRGHPIQGTITFRDGQVRFDDATNPSRSFVVQLRQVVRVESEEYPPDGLLQLSVFFERGVKPVARIETRISPADILRLLSTLLCAGVSLEW